MAGCGYDGCGTSAQEGALCDTCLVRAAPVLIDDGVGDGVLEREELVPVLGYNDEFDKVAGVLIKASITLFL